MTDKPKYQKKGDPRPATAAEESKEHRGGRGGRGRGDAARGGEPHRGESHRGGRGGRGGAEIKPASSGEDLRPHTSGGKGNFNKRRDGDQ